MTKEQAIKFANCLKNNYTIDIYHVADFCDMVINALEIVEEFERARIITGGRLNGRTYAYKCGLEDGKRKALEQQPSDDVINRKADNLCNSCINIGCEFQSGIVRTECAFYMPQNIEPDNCGNYVVMQQPSDDCVSRKAMLNAITEIDNNVNMDIYTNEVREIVKELPPVTPTRKVGKWEYKQLGFRKYGFVCTSCGYAIHIGYDFNSMEEFKDMIETKLQNPHITKDKYCCKCGAEMVGTEND